MKLIFVENGSSVKQKHKSFIPRDKGSPFLKYVGPIWAQIALDPPAPLCQTGKCGKKCLKPSWQAFTPAPLTGNAHMKTTHFKKGLPLAQWL